MMIIKAKHNGEHNEDHEKKDDDDHNGEIMMIIKVKHNGETILRPPKMCIKTQSTKYSWSHGCKVGRTD